MECKRYLDLKTAAAGVSTYYPLLDSGMGIRG